MLMRHYIIYNTLREKFIHASKDIAGDIADYRLVDVITEATVFTHPKLYFQDFEECHFVIDALNFLKCHSGEFSKFIFCACNIKYNKDNGLLDITHVDYLYPLLECWRIDDRIGESVIFK